MKDIQVTRPVSLRGSLFVCRSNLFRVKRLLRFARNDTIYKMILAMTLVFYSTASFATPPTSITLTYDLDKGSLHVDAVHPSFNLDKSYVRLMNVYVNGREVFTQDYFRQKNYEGFSDDVPVAAQAGDVIKVELFCTLGGDMSKELTVGQPEAPQPDQSADMAVDNTAY